MFGMQNKSIFENITLNEQDYLKAIFHLTIDSNLDKVGTNKLAEQLSLSPGSVNLMIKKLKSKNLVEYEKYGKINLTDEGEEIALRLIRKHRLWETFLCEHLNFTWDEVHNIAEQLEHINSEKLIDRLEEFMNFPEKDPHGSLIPQKNKEYKFNVLSNLSEYEPESKVKVISIDDASDELLKYATSINISIGTEIKILEKRKFDNSILISIKNKEIQITNQFAESIFVE